MSGGGGKGSSSIIPSGSRSIVKSLKEIVNCPEAEIYATLKECNMDPDETVNRLLSQDTFHEVKSKREKKKETKETADSRLRTSFNTTNHGNRNGSDRNSSRGGSSRFNSNESSGVHGKPAYKKEDGMHGCEGSSSSASEMAGNSTNQWTPSISGSVSIENKMATVGMSNAIPTQQPSSGLQSAWGGVPGQVSMADIVKRGLPQKKTPTLPKTPYLSVDHQGAVAPYSARSHHDLHSSQDHVSKVYEVDTEAKLVSNEHDEWPSIEQPPVISFSPVLEASAGAELYTDSSSVSFERTDQPVKSQLDEVQVSEDDDVERLETNDAHHIHEDNSRGSSQFDNKIYENMSSYQSHRHPFEHTGAEDGASAVAANLQKLRLQNDGQGIQPEEDERKVIIPDHLQVHTPDCSHLSFGSFGPIGSRPLKNNLEDPSEAADNSIVGHLDNRSSEYYGGDNHLRNNTDENIVHQVNANTGNYDPPSVSPPEVLKEDSESSQENQYAFPPSAPGYNYENMQQQLNATFSHQQPISQMQYLSPFSSVMQAYSDSLPGSLLGPGVPTAKEPELPYSPFPVMQQSMPTKYSSTASGPSISMPEALSAASISTPQPTAQTLAGANVATGPALPQPLAMHQYAQLGPFPNMISYPFMHQSFAYMPQASAFQQAFAGNSNYHQSLAAAMLPQFKNSGSVSSLPQSAAVPPGYGFPTSSGGNFPLNPSTAQVAYDDVLSSQLRDNNHLLSLQQNDNSAMWVHGHGPRTMPAAVPGNTYYSYQEQNQQAGGFQQGQQQPPSQNFGGAHGYANYYQTGMPVEHQQQQQQQQTPRDGGSEDQQSKQAQQLWRNNY